MMNAMEQATFADLDYECKKRKTRREIFLERMDGLIHGKSLRSGYDLTIPRRGEGGVRMSCRRCCVYTVCNCSTT